MDNKNSELANENMKLMEKLEKIERQNADLKDENAKLKKQINAIYAANSMSNSSVQSAANSSQQSNTNKNKRTNKEELDDLAAKRPKLWPKSVPNWLVEVFAWIDRIELANSSLSYSSQIFHRLCWSKLHGNIKPHKLPLLKFFPARYELGNVRALMRIENQIIPIASVPPPNYILNIEELIISFVNEEVSMLLKSIAHLLQNCSIRFFWSSRWPKENNKKRAKTTYDILKCLAGKIFKLEFCIGAKLSDFYVQFPGIIEQIPMLSINEFNLENNLLLDWLTKQRTDGSQKLLNITNYCTVIVDIASLVNLIKEEFSHSSIPSPFLLCHKYGNVGEFTVENERTNEILTSYRSSAHASFYLARYPKGEKHWKEEGEQKMWQPRMPDTTYIKIVYIA